MFLASTIKPLLNLQSDCIQLQRNQIPLLLLISRSDCRFCLEVRRNYLTPLADSHSEQVLMVRELQSDTALSVIDRDGKHLTTSILLKRLKANFYPTVLFLAYDLSSLTDPLIGLDQAGFYGAYLERAIEAAKAQAKRMS